MYFTVYTHPTQRNIFSSLCIKSRVKILNSSAKYWGGPNTLWPPQPNYWRGHGPPGPPYRAPHGITEWPYMCWSAVKNILTHSLTQSLVHHKLFGENRSCQSNGRLFDVFNSSAASISWCAFLQQLRGFHVVFSTFGREMTISATNHIGHSMHHICHTQWRYRPQVNKN